MDSQNSGFYASLLNGEVDITGEFAVQDSQSEHGNGHAQSYEVVTQLSGSSKRGKRSGNFSVEEDNLLVSAWLNISLDAIHSTDQKMDKYWGRVHEFFHQNKNFSSNRSSNSLMNRWSVIQKAVNKFCGCYAQIDRRQQSGITEHDKILHAKVLYTELYKVTFAFENCWNRLRYEAKWLVNGERQKPHKTRKEDIPIVENSSTPDASNLEDENTEGSSPVSKPRPAGKKLEKERIKNKKNREEVDNAMILLMEEMKEEKKKSSSVKIEILRKLLAIEEKKEEERIMSLDLSQMPQLQVDYYIERQKEIVEKTKRAKLF